MYRIFASLLIIIALASCEPELTTDFSFLEGSWKAPIDDYTYLLESWKKESDLRYTALTYEVSDSGMKLSEQITLDITDSGTFYKPMIEGLNGGHEFSYTFVSQKDNLYQFENKENKVFLIWYKLIDDKHLEAGIREEEGKDKFVLSFEKVEE